MILDRKNIGALDVKALTTVSTSYLDKEVGQAPISHPPRLVSIATAQPICEPLSLGLNHVNTLTAAQCHHANPRRQIQNYPPEINTMQGPSLVGTCVQMILHINTMRSRVGRNVLPNTI